MAKLKTMTIKVKGEDQAEKDLIVAMVGPNGHPIYEIEGKEVEQDVVQLRDIITERNKESADRRKAAEDLKTQLALFEGIEPDKARAALTLAANLDSKKLMDAGQVELMKSQWEESFKANKAAGDAAYETKISQVTQDLEVERNNIKKMLIQDVFTDSKFLEGTTFDKLRDGAYKMFGDKFVVEQDDNGSYKVVAKNPDGTPILSVARPGQVATTDEAIEHIILTHPQKDYILLGSLASGSGAQGGAGGGAKGTIQQIQAAYDDAVKRQDATAIVSLKRQLFEAQRTLGGGGAR